MASIFSSRNDQSQRCYICYSDEKTDLEENGPIVNHLVGKHTGAHARCMVEQFKKGVNWLCAVCHTPLNPHSFPLTRGVRQGQSAMDLTKAAAQEHLKNLIQHAGASVLITTICVPVSVLILVNILCYIYNRPWFGMTELGAALLNSSLLRISFSCFLVSASIATALVVQQTYKRIAAIAPPAAAH